jgi:hypothetical protein
VERLGPLALSKRLALHLSTAVEKTAIEQKAASRFGALCVARARALVASSYV